MKAPPKKAPPTPVEYSRGEEVEIIAGLSKGVRGVVKGPTRIPFGDILTYAVLLPGHEGVRTIRVDYLRRVA